MSLVWEGARYRDRFFDHCLFDFLGGEVFWDCFEVGNETYWSLATPFRHLSAMWPTATSCLKLTWNLSTINCSTKKTNTFISIILEIMKTIGLIGGMSWESSLEYYRIINEKVKEKLGGLHSAKSLMYSVDFDEIEKLQHQGNWGEATKLMIDAAQRLERGGADFVIICTNTMHKMADEVQNNIKMPLLHIADATAERIQAKGLKKIGLLGTKFTMEEDFYK
jgi:aspartate racemase